MNHEYKDKFWWMELLQKCIEDALNPDQICQLRGELQLHARTLSFSNKPQD